MSAADLPTELIDQSMEYLWDDKLTLSSCSLVSSSWLNGSRRVLFADINIVADPGTLPLFVEFIQQQRSANPSRHIRRLCIRPPNHKPEEDEQHILDKPEPFSRYLQSILLLDALRCLELRDLKIGIIAPLKAPSKLEELTFVSNRIASHSEEELVGLIRQLPALRSLKFDAPYLSYTPTPLRLSGQLCPSEGDSLPIDVSHLETLTLRHARLAPYFMDILALRPPTETLRSLEVSLRRNADIDAIGGLLDVLGHNLTHFGICMSELLARNPGPISIALDKMHLQNLTSLKSLTCHVNFCGEPWSSLPFNSAVLRNATQFLSHVIRERLEVLTFCLFFDGAFDREVQITRPLETRLRGELAWLEEAPETMPRLREIRWVWVGIERQKRWDTGWGEQTRRRLNEVVRSCYPRLEERGLLQFPKSEDWF